MALDDVPYKGVNTIVTSPNGYKFELQFHTPESFEVKPDKNHPLFEEWRVLDPASTRAKELEKQMIENGNKITKPVDIRLIKAFSKLK